MVGGQGVLLVDRKDGRWTRRMVGGQGGLLVNWEKIGELGDGW